jgi:hypothetical protein
MSKAAVKPNETDNTAKSYGALYVGGDCSSAGGEATMGSTISQILQPKKIGPLDQRPDSQVRFEAG